jgi:hypothetical protein
MEPAGTILGFIPAAALWAAAYLWFRETTDLINSSITHR